MTLKRAIVQVIEALTIPQPVGCNVREPPKCAQSVPSGTAEAVAGPTPARALSRACRVGDLAGG